MNTNEIKCKFGYKVSVKKREHKVDTWLIWVTNEVKPYVVYQKSKRGRCFCEEQKWVNSQMIIKSKIKMPRKSTRDSGHDKGDTGISLSFVLIEENI